MVHHLMVHHLLKSVRGLVGSALTGTGFVRPCLTDAELASYLDDMASLEEARRVERHVCRCPVCAEALDHAHVMLIGPPAGSESLPPAPLMRAVLIAAAEIRGAKAAAAGRGKRLAPARRFSAAMAALLLAVAIPAIACLAAYGILAHRAPAPGRSATVLMTTPSSTCPEPKKPAQRPAGLSALIDQKLSSAAQQALAESGLPQTAEQQAAWARKEFPHVMDLYNLIKSGGSPIVILTVSNRVMVMPAARAADLNALAKYELVAPGGGGWDGVAVWAPEWAQYVYAGSALPSGWQALLVLSGEVFKLDCPRSLQDHNVNPTIQGALAAGAVAGWAARQDAALLSLQLPPPSSAVTPEYVSVLASNLELAQSVVAYVAVSSELVQTPAFAEIAALAKSLLEEMYSSTSPCKRSVQTREVLLQDLFARRQQALRRARAPMGAP